MFFRRTHKFWPHLIWNWTKCQWKIAGFMFWWFFHFASLLCLKDFFPSRMTVQTWKDVSDDDCSALSLRFFHFKWDFTKLSSSLCCVLRQNGTQAEQGSAPKGWLFAKGFSKSKVSANTTCRWDYVGWASLTPPKFNIAPEKLPSQKVSSLPTIHFQGLC